MCRGSRVSSDSPSGPEPGFRRREWISSPGHNSPVRCISPWRTSCRRLGTVTNQYISTKQTRMRGELSPTVDVHMRVEIPIDEWPGSSTTLMQGRIIERRCTDFSPQQSSCAAGYRLEQDVCMNSDSPATKSPGSDGKPFLRSQSGLILVVRWTSHFTFSKTSSSF